MDELEISGKRYISSKRIAKENKYHSDYIGQLIRGGKILGTKVGRAWYVEERSFADYLNKEDKTYIAPAPQVAPVQVVTPTPVEIVETILPEPEPMPAMQSPVIVEKKEEYMVPVRKEEVFISEPQAVRNVPIKKAGLTYISDSSPLFPAIQKRTTAPAEKALPAVAIRPASFQKPTVHVEPAQVQKRNPYLTALSITAVGALGVIVLTFVFFGSLGLDTTVTVQKGQPASVAYSQEKTLCFIFGTCQNTSDTQ